MVYGENAGLIRTQLTTLLRQHRIQQRIGGPGSHTIPETTSVQERGEIGRLIQRYRHGILTWCHQAVRAENPIPHLGRPAHVTSADSELSRCLQRTVDASTSALPSLEDLTTPHEFPLVDAWRLAARAALLGEHDLTGDLAAGRLDVDQRLTVVKDAAEIVRALLVLDRRYDKIPEWQRVPGAASLRRAAEGCAFLTADDYSIDRLGWRPPEHTIDGPPRPGIAGVVQAEHNLLVHLNRIPSALNLKRLLDSQRELSHDLADRTIRTAPGLSVRWTRREATYAALQREARNLGGHIGNAGAAAAEGANAILRLRQLTVRTHLDHRALHALDSLFDRVDHRLTDIIEHGVRERLYFVKAKPSRMISDDGQVIHRGQERFLPITTPDQTDLLGLLRHHLRPKVKPPDSPPGASESRRELSRGIRHRPPSRPNTPEL
ncbi:MAG: hypothetical protein ACTHOK_01295 [Nocardioidaceae bacterium]